MPRADRVLFAGLAFALLVAGSAARGQGLPGLDQKLLEARDEPVTLTADQLEYEHQREVYVARGNVVIVQGERTLTADWVAFNPETGAGVASGHVELLEGTDVLRADFVDFNANTLEGVIREGSLDSPEGRFRTWGSEIQKTGEDTYTFQNGVFTTCRCPDEDDTEPWRLRAREAEVEIGGYGTLRDATVEVLGVPVFWLPWMIYPIKTERESGFLFPELSIASRDGFGVGLPFFWAVNDQVNLTLTPEWTSERGFKGSGDLEYVAGEESYGEAVAAFGYDEKIDPNSRREPYDRERWLAGGRHDWSLPADLRFATDHNFVSDNEVPLDYDELSASRADRYLESTAYLSRDFGASGRVGGLASIWFADDLQNPDDVDRDDVLLQRWTHARADALVGGIPGIPLLQPSIDTEYTWFGALDRASGAPGFLDLGVDGVSTFDEIQRLPPSAVTPDPHGDDFSATNPLGTEGDGFFQEGEPLTDSGHRAIFHPKVAAPFRLGRFAEVLPEVGWHQTLWSSRQHGGDQRGLLTGRVDLRSRLRRHFANDLVHLIEPRVGWAYVSPEAQSRKPLFVPEAAVPQERLRILELDNVTRDTADRIDRAHQISFGVTQRLLGGLDTEKPRPRELRADVTVLGLYDLADGQFGNVVLDGRLTPYDAGDLRFHLGVAPDGRDFIQEGLAEWSWSHRDGHALSTSYRFIRNIPLVFEDFRTGDRFDDVEPEDQVDEVGLNVRVALTPLWTAYYRMAYSFETDLLIGNKGVLEYLSRCGCWSVGAEFSEDRARGVEVKFLYRIIGLGNDQDPNAGGLLDW